MKSLNQLLNKYKSYNSKINCIVAVLGSIVTIGAIQSSASAVSFTVTEIKTDEGFIFNDPNSAAVTPTGLNSVNFFTVNGQPEISTGNFFAIETEGVTTPFPIQPKSLDGTPLTTKLFADDDDYLSAGVNGLSLSTGVNKVVNQAIETLVFPVLSINTNAIGDGIVDFFTADIALNQSPDTWRLLDANGDLVASLTTNSSDWNTLGSQFVNRWNNAGNNLDTAWGNTARTVSGLAFEISDFTLEQGASFEDVTSMTLTIAEQTNQPRTDYAFISSNTDSITFVNQVQSPEAVPEPTTILATLTALGVGGLLKKKNMAKSYK